MLAVASPSSSPGERPELEAAREASLALAELAEDERTCVVDVASLSTACNQPRPVEVEGLVACT